MKAAVLREFKQSLSLEDVEPPKPGPSDVLIEVEACGVCHSDLHLAEGDWPQFAGIVKRPLILGHEIAGRVVEAGSDVRDLRAGDRVGVPWVYWSCGECEYCREGNETLCVRQKITGVTVDGGYAELIVAPASHATRMPDGLSAVQAAPLFCAGVTVYRALKNARIERGQRLAVIGVGGLGHLAVQIAREMGAEITAIDISDEKLALATSLGAAATLNAANSDVAKKVRAIGGFHVVLVTSAAKAAYDLAFRALRGTGTLLVVGLPAEHLSFPAIMMAAREARIQATSVGTRQDLREVLSMAAAGKIHCQISTHFLPEVNTVLNHLREGRISGRAVLTFH